MSKRAFLFAVSLSGFAGALQGANQYLQHNLVADLPGRADYVDANLVNPWGICTSATSPFWISDNGTGLSTLYSAGPTSLNTYGLPNATTKPVVPATGAAATPGAPTGCVANAVATAFIVGTTTRSASFLFATENGSLSGWNSADATKAVVQVDNSAKGAVYKGLAIATPSAAIGPRLYATNFNAGTVEVYDQTWKLITVTGGFTDASIPAGFAPFGIQAIGTKVYVTYAKQDAKKHDDVGGAGNGYVDVFDLDGTLLARLVAGGSLNSPWGVAIAPAGFGDYAGKLLVGNFGDGTINVYDATTGALTAALQDAKGAKIQISGLWGLLPGNGGSGGDANAVYFAAGTDGETHGLFGSLQAGPAIAPNAVVNAASFGPLNAPGGFVSVVGTNLAPIVKSWGAADIVNGKLPTTLGGVSVTMNGKPAYIYYVSPTQINLIAAADTTQGAVPVVVTSNGIVSASLSATMGTYSPELFISKTTYAAAFHADNTVVGPTTLYPNNSTPAKPGETISLYGTGLGPTTPANDGVMVTSPLNLATQPTVTVGGLAATVTFAGVTSAGLDQINITVPAASTDGDHPVVITIGGASSKAVANISTLK
jgi:uncharacterized protein (TIGR03118 family)